MTEASYYDYIYQIMGESLVKAPKDIFNDDGVYLIVDLNLKTIWVWAGSNSRLFHRYIAASWAGKLKSKKNFYGFKYEVIKQDKEPGVFKSILEEISKKDSNITFPGQTRKEINQEDFFQEKESNFSLKPVIADLDLNLSRSEKNTMKLIISEIREIQMHIKYSLEHVERRIVKLEKILES